MSTIIKKLDGVKGKLFLHHKEEERIIDYKIDNDVVAITTDKKTYVKSFGDVPILLSEFLPIDERMPATKNKNSDSHFQTLTVLNSTGAEQIKNILMDNIKKVQESSSYIPQAKQINTDVNSLIELAKAEIDIIKLTR